LAAAARPQVTAATAPIVFTKALRDDPEVGMAVLSHAFWFDDIQSTVTCQCSHRTDAAGGMRLVGVDRGSRGRDPVFQFCAHRLAATIEFPDDADRVARRDTGGRREKGFRKDRFRTPTITDCRLELGSSAAKAIPLGIAIHMRPIAANGQMR
jgi:hypothetical protein